MPLQEGQLRAKIEDLEKTAVLFDEKSRIMEMAASSTGPEEVISTETYLEAMQKLRGNTETFRVMSGLDSLDQLCEGFSEGEVVVISGPTKEGKTTLCQTLTIQFCNLKIGCLWLPFDTPGEELIRRFSTPITFYLPRKNATAKKVSWIEEKIIEGIAKFNTKIVFIDHLGMLVRATDRQDNRSTELQSIMAELKEIAIKWRVVIFLNHHIRKIPDFEKPGLADLKDSSGVAQDADTVLFVWRAKEKTDFGWDYKADGLSMLSLQAHRKTGRRGFIKLKHHGDHFTEYKLEIGETTKTINGPLI
jgi:replicative DNA helicase